MKRNFKLLSFSHLDCSLASEDPHVRSDKVSSLTRASVPIYQSPDIIMSSAATEPAKESGKSPHGVLEPDESN